MKDITIKRIAVKVLPPVVADVVRALRRKFTPPPELEYSPSGWDESLVGSTSEGWNADSVVEATRLENEATVQHLKDGGPLGVGHQHNLNVTFAFVVAQAARDKSSLSILDYGSGLGHYYLITKAVLPNVSIDYHCKEMPALVAAGRQIVPNATWHSDDTCLDRGYDLVILSGVLQCMKDWESQLRAIGAVANEWLFVTRTPIVESAKTYAAVLHTYGSAMLHWQFNRAQLLSFVKSLGFAIEREFDIGDRHQVKDGPEPFELRGWLFKRVNT